ncbi:hypothetical protein [Tumebacillus permanentifrigoris]|uniref:Uncharacterized protein n=1 Tax=Tumebacillus permanentifrigoris TaxID=378543 RepID=A0A316DAU9_9BACL|nr:hypothetical protein [Tumebacillus permanentifrigoris]PWK13952.1 hypothetical protein C7459_106249 [Tumebacillus permanentifrigoris]
MEVFICQSLNKISIEMGCVVVANSEKEAKKQVVKDFKAKGWDLSEEHVHLTKVNTTVPHTVIIDPLND